MEENKSVIDTRTFPEVWKSLTPLEQGFLRHSLMCTTTATRQTICNWINGGKPVYQKTRSIVAATINRVFHMNTKKEFLFPEKKVAK